MIGVISYHLSTVVIDSPSTSWCTPAMTIFSPGFKPSEMRVCASPVGVAHGYLSFVDFVVFYHPNIHFVSFAFHRIRR